MAGKNNEQEEQLEALRQQISSKGNNAVKKEQTNKPIVEKQVVDNEPEQVKPKPAQGKKQGVRNQQAVKKQASQSGGNQKFVIIGIGAALALVIVIIVVMGITNKKSVEEQPVEEEAQEIDYGAVSGFAYGDDQIEQLRAAGYTGTEIENFQSQAMDFAQLMSKARADQKLFKLENDFNFYDIESDEFKSSVDNTWLSLPKRTDAEDFAENFAEYRVQDVNLDYEKVEPRGNQLFLKVYLDDNVHEDWFFLMVTPEEWAKLDDYGNVECEYTYATRYIGDNMYNLEVDPDTMYITEAHLNILEKYDYDSTDESTTN